MRPTHGRPSGAKAAARALALGLLALGSLAVAGCGGEEADAGAATSWTTSPSSTSTETTEALPEGFGLPDQYDQRYCEVLAVSVTEQGASAEVWGTQGMNDCPQEAFEVLDPDAIAAGLGADLAVLNGPRYWTLDRILAKGLAGSLETRDMGGMQMRSIATVDIDEEMEHRSPLTEVSVARVTAFVFEPGRRIHELKAPDGSVYVMQSYSVEVDPTLTAEGLDSLGGRLTLPEGWSFTSRVLEEELVVEDVEGIATVIQDELRNTYQLRSRA